MLELFAFSRCIFSGFEYWLELKSVLALEKCVWYLVFCTSGMTIYLETIYFSLNNFVAIRVCLCQVANLINFPRLSFHLVLELFAFSRCPLSGFYYRLKLKSFLALWELRYSCFGICFSVCLI